jgi:cytochrome c oxidase subunit 2
MAIRSRTPASHLVICLFLILACFALWACISDSETKAPDSATGETLFRQSVIGSSAGCSTCHSTEPGIIIIGPSLAGLAVAAGGRVEGQSAEAYIRESILNPDAHLVEGYPQGVMPAKYAEQLSTEQVDNLVAYLLTLK